MSTPPPAPTLLVLAAGMGSRYGGLKQLDGVGVHNETVLEYAVYDALAAGFERVVFVIRRDFEEQFRRYVDERFADRIAVDYAFQAIDDLPLAPPFSVGDRKKPWGTAHAVWTARRALHGPFAVVNADDFYGRDAFERVAAFLRRPTDPTRPTASLVGFVLRNTLSPHGGVSRGVCTTDTEGQLCRIEELTSIRMADTGPVNVFADGSIRKLEGTELVSMNMWGFSAAIVSELERQLGAFLSGLTAERRPTAECYLPACVDALIRERRLTVDVLATRGRWFGVTYPDDKPAVEAALRELTERGEYPRGGLWSDPNSGASF